MIKDDLITLVHQALGREVSRAGAEAAVQAVFHAIEKGLREDGKVQVPGFGSFDVHERAARAGHHPGTGERIEIPESKTVRFRPGKSLRENL